MASSPTNDPPLPPVKIDPLAALLSYLIPGLGQIYQGRVGKGMLFFGGLYLLFFYGMWMGQWKNVWLPDATDLPDVAFVGQNLGGVPKAISYRPQFLGQFWIGMAAWPGVYQYFTFDKTKDEGPMFGKYQRMPEEKELNDLQRNGNKRWDLGWVYTVIAGVLNLLVMYDAFAGPMFRDPPPASLTNQAEIATIATLPAVAVGEPPPLPAMPPIFMPPEASPLPPASESLPPPLVQPQGGAS